MFVCTVMFGLYDVPLIMVVQDLSDWSMMNCSYFAKEEANIM